jgi:hypothetical protein
MYKSVRRSGVSSFASSFGRSRLFRGLFRPCGLPAALRPCCAPALHLRFFGVSVTVSKYMYVRESVSAVESDRCRSSILHRPCRTVCVPAPPVSFSGSKVRISCSGLLVHVKHLELSPVNRGWLCSCGCDKGSRGPRATCSGNRIHMYAGRCLGFELHVNHWL